MSVFFSIFSAASIYLTIPLLRTLFLSEDAQTTAPVIGTGFTDKIQAYIQRFLLEGGKESALVKVCVLILIAFLFRISQVSFRCLYAESRERVLRDVRYELYEKINSLSLRYFTQEKTGNLISRMTNDLNLIQSGISAAFSNLLKDPC